MIRAVASEPYYRRDLALVHHLGFGFHAEACAPGILTLLEPVRERGGLVLEPWVVGRPSRRRRGPPPAGLFAEGRVVRWARYAAVSQ